jgi:SAM-dependent methyltransferase
VTGSIDQATASASPDPVPDVESLVARLRERVEQRRRDGGYPVGLEAGLDAHFQRIAAHRPVPYDYEGLRSRMRSLEDSMTFSPAKIAYESGLPGGAALHRTVGKAVSRQTAGILEQLQGFAVALRDVLAEMTAVLEHPNAHVHSELLGQVDALMEHAASWDRRPGEGDAELLDLQRRLERLETVEATRSFRPWFGNATFEEEFRGSKADLADRYADLAHGFIGYDPVVDLGCGRGEFLELLAKEGVDATGIEIDPELVRLGLEKGLRVEQADAVAWLAGSADQSMGGVALIQVIEHLTPQQRSEVVRLAAEKLRPGGRLLIETLNPQSLYIYARAFYVDPTHDTPMHPAFLDFLLRQAGFKEISIEWRSPPPAAEMVQRVEGAGQLVDDVNANAERINAILFGPQDYAISATR